MPIFGIPEIRPARRIAEARHHQAKRADCRSYSVFHPADRPQAWLSGEAADFDVNQVVFVRSNDVAYGRHDHVAGDRHIVDVARLQ